MTPRAIFNTILGFLVLAAIAGGIFAVRSYNTAIEQAAQLDGLRDELNAERVARALETGEHIKRTEFDTRLRAARATTTHRLETVANEDPDAGAYLHQRIPDSVRNAVRGPR